MPTVTLFHRSTQPHVLRFVTETHLWRINADFVEFTPTTLHDCLFWARPTQRMQTRGVPESGAGALQLTISLLFPCMTRTSL